jgi:CDP-glycerol glycerophosphotransferase (TagB/SpsB family)
MYTQNDKKRNILPDYTLVWGEYWKNFLINEGNYPEEALRVTGQIRTDIIPKIIENPKLIHSFIQLPRNKKIILFASQPQRDAELRKLAAYDVFSAAKKTANAHLLFKLHPAEKNDFDYYQQIAKEANCHNYTIIYEADLYILIASADVVITCFSTVGAETTYFFKPLIILDHLKQDVQHYYKEGIAFQATDGPMLTEYIEHILDGKKELNKEAYNKYRSRFAYKIDGKVSERVINFIQSI